MPRPGSEAKASLPPLGGKEDAPKGRREARGRTADERSLDELGALIEEKWDTVFAGVSLVLPVTGCYGVENSPTVARGLVGFAKRNPKFRKALERAADGMDAVEIARVALGVGIAIQVDLGRLKSDALPAQVMGVTAVVEKMEGIAEDDGSFINNNVMTMPEPPHARFVPTP